MPLRRPDDKPQPRPRLWGATAHKQACARELVLLLLRERGSAIALQLRTCTVQPATTAGRVSRPAPPGHPHHCLGLSAWQLEPPILRPLRWRETRAGRQEFRDSAPNLLCNLGWVHSLLWAFLERLSHISGRKKVQPCVGPRADMSIRWDNVWGRALQWKRYYYFY